MGLRFGCRGLCTVYKTVWKPTDITRLISGILSKQAAISPNKYIRRFKTFFEGDPGENKLDRVADNDNCIGPLVNDGDDQRHVTFA